MKLLINCQFYLEFFINLKKYTKISSQISIMLDIFLFYQLKI